MKYNWPNNKYLVAIECLLEISSTNIKNLDSPITEGSVPCVEIRRACFSFGYQNIMCNLRKLQICA